nr:hypothetical protein Iba_scaffold13727CG0050 [Ipomoea batatas]
MFPQYDDPATTNLFLVQHIIFFHHPQDLQWQGSQNNNPSNTFFYLAHFPASLVIYAHPDRQHLSFCELPFSKAHSLYKA